MPVIETRLQFFPIMLFAVVMGFSGLALVYQKAHGLFGFPSFLGNGLAYIDLALFIAVALFYGAKLLRYPDEVKQEFRHPVRINFFAAISISLLLLAIVYEHLCPTLSAATWYAGVVLHTFFTFYTVSFWINHNFEIQHSNPAWFIPIVGNVIIPVGGIHYAPTEFLFFYFSVGLLFWVVLLTIIMNRIIFHNQLAAKFMPTLFILIAPPAVGFIAWYKMTGTLDHFAQFLLMLTLFFTFLIAFMYKNFVKIKFFISWWAFTFPMAAATLAVMLAFSLTHSSFYQLLSWILLVATTLIVSVVAYQTVLHMLKREICVAE